MGVAVGVDVLRARSVCAAQLPHLEVVGVELGEQEAAELEEDGGEEEPAPKRGL